MWYFPAIQKPNSVCIMPNITWTFPSSSAQDSANIQCGQKPANVSLKKDMALDEVPTISEYLLCARCFAFIISPNPHHTSISFENLPVVARLVSLIVFSNTVQLPFFPSTLSSSWKTRNRYMTQLESCFKAYSMVVKSLGSPVRQPEAKLQFCHVITV